MRATARNSTASSTASKPRSWPNDVTFLIQPVYSTNNISAEILESLNQKPTSIESIDASPGVCPHVRITAITASDHPANGQHGLFASQNLSAGSFILLYLGFFHGQVDTDPKSDYDLSLDRELGISIDATRMGNEARFINDYRGISSSGPNAEFREVWVCTGKGLVEKRMAVFALPAGKSGKRAKGIGKGQEILVSYGKGFWKERVLQENPS